MSRPPSLSAPFIVVVDDDPAMRELLFDLCSSLGRVEAVAGGVALREFLAEVATGDKPQPNAVVSDVIMPGFTGLQALAWVRNHLPGLKVVLVTAFGDATVHKRARELGAVELVDKPFSAKQLLSAVRAALASNQPLG